MHRTVSHDITGARTTFELVVSPTYLTSVALTMTCDVNFSTNATIMYCDSILDFSRLAILLDILPIVKTSS